MIYGILSFPEKNEIHLFKMNELEFNRLVSLTD